MFISCSDDDNPAGSSGTFTKGLYNITSATIYDTADCSGAGTISLEMSNEECHDRVNTTEDTCTDSYWEAFCNRVVFTLSTD